jgi:FSR family fosmidomycin resistance protein-like MFS transporter
MNLLRDRSFVASGFAHLAVDLLNSTRAVYLAFLSQPLNLTNTLIGLIGTLYTLLGSLSQPLFGYLADRVGKECSGLCRSRWSPDH